MPPECQEIVRGIMKSVEAELIAESTDIKSKKPDITRDKELLLGAVYTSAELRGQRRMHDRLMEAMGLTNPTQNDNM